jgi:phosphate transport system substrate-binding protein
MKTRSGKIFTIICFVGNFICSACSQTSVPGNTATPVLLPSLTTGEFPTIDGSTSTNPLGSMIACAIMDVPCEWGEFIDGNRYLMPNLTDFQGDFPGAGHQGTHSAYLNLINGEADLILVARSPSMEELELAQISGVSLAIKPVALDAFVFIVHEDNPVDGLTIDEIRSIYSGELTNWNQVGGPQTEIHPYQRDEQSGSQQLMQSLVMKNLPMVEAPLLVLLKMIAPFYAISEDPLGIGYSVYYYEENMAPNENIKLLAVDGIKPDRETIQSRLYPFTTEVYVVVRADSSPTSVALRLRDWLLSPAGQDLVVQSGYVSYQK